MTSPDDSPQEQEKSSPSLTTNVSSDGQVSNLTNIAKADKVNIFNKGTSRNTITRQDYRNRRYLLNIVKNEVASRLKQSLHNQVLINIEKEQQSELVKHPWDAEIRIGINPNEPLPKTTKIVEVFDRQDIAGNFLILGDPGSGKTTTQLELAQTLIERAEEDSDYPIPVLLNLSSWKDERESIIEWLVTALKTKYGIGTDISTKWLEKRQLLLLLDGLDELKSIYQEPCVQAINSLIAREYRPRYLVVCSRIQEYSNYDTRLQLNGAIYLKPLTNMQIHDYLNAINHIDLSQIVSKNVDLLLLVNTPLLLSMTVLVSDEISLEYWQQLKSTSERINFLLNAYIERMLRPRQRINTQIYIKKNIPTTEQTLRWLGYLSQQLNKESRTEFLIEEIQPSWLKNRIQKVTYIFSICLMGAVLGCIGGLIGLSIEASYPLLFSDFGYLEPIYNPIIGMLIGIVGGLSVISKGIQNVFETIAFSWQRFQKSLLENIISGFILSLFQLFFLNKNFISALYTFLAMALLFTVVASFSEPDVDNKVLPNQGIRQSLKNSLMFALVSFPFSILFIVLSQNVLGFPFSLHSLIFALGIPISAALLYGGATCINHFTIRLILYRNGWLPWNYARFLDYCTERLFLQRVGGRYRFIHKMLQDHFAARVEN